MIKKRFISKEYDMAESNNPGTLAIHGGDPLRTRPFGPRWYFGEEEKRQLAEVIDDASEPADTNG